MGRVFVPPLSGIMLQTSNVWGKRYAHRGPWCVGDNIRAHGVYLHLCHWSGNLCVRQQICCGKSPAVWLLARCCSPRKVHAISVDKALCCSCCHRRIPVCATLLQRFSALFTASEVWTVKSQLSVSSWAKVSYTSISGLKPQLWKCNICNPCNQWIIWLISKCHTLEPPCRP